MSSRSTVAHVNLVVGKYISMFLEQLLWRLFLEKHNGATSLLSDPDHFLGKLVRYKVAFWVLDIEVAILILKHLVEGCIVA